jgi:hypothetical protein
MSFAKGTDTIVLEKKQTVSDADIVAYYLGITKIPTRIKSPLRKDDKPSFGLYSRDGEHIYYTDFATGDKGHIIDLLKQMWGMDYTETWEKIVNDIAPTNGVSIKRTISIPKVEILSKNRTQIQVKIREWKNYDLEYWASYGINLEWLKFANVYPISHIIFTKENQEATTTPADKYAYVFVEFKEGNTTYKVYQPHNKRGFKWFSSHDRSVISLWTKVPEYGDKIVICSSLKDALCLWSNTGIPAISPQGEGYGMSDTAISELKRRYKNIYILFDNDKAGIADGKKLAEQTGFINVVLPYFLGGKDVSDKFKFLQNPAKFKAEIINLLNT